MDEEINRNSTSFRRVRRAKVVGVLGAMGLGLGALLAFTHGSFGHYYTPASEQAPGIEAPADDQPTTNRMDDSSSVQGLGATPTTTPSTTPQNADPTRFQDMQAVDPVFDETHRNDINTGDSETDATTPARPEPGQDTDKNAPRSKGDVERMPPAGYAQLDRAVLGSRP